jgi:hypothetical protein
VPTTNAAGPPLRPDNVDVALSSGVPDGPMQHPSGEFALLHI